MSIEREHDRSVLYCDGYKCKARIVCDEFNDAVDYKKSNGWRSRKVDGEWVDLCPDCQREENHG